MLLLDLSQFIGPHSWRMVDTLLSCLHLFLLLVGLFGALLLLVLEGLHVATNKIFHDKASLQLLQCTTGCAIVAALMATLMGCSTNACVASLSWIAVGIFAGALALTIFLFVHQKLRKLAVIRFVLALCVCLTPFAAIALWMQKTGAQPFALRLWIFIDGAPAFIPHLLTLGLSAASALCLMWLAVRRNVADYGRDYYAYAVRFFSCWALVCMLFSTAIIGYAVIMEVYTKTQGQPTAPLWYLTLVFAIPLAACIVWGIAAKSATPMRHKPGLYLACLLTFATLCIHTHFYILNFQGLVVP